MGQKLNISLDDPLFDNLKKKPTGISGGCYCCGRQIHLQFSDFSILPTAKINTKLFNILICDVCEDDVVVLEKTGFSMVNYDVLFYIQEKLRDKTSEIYKDNKDITEKERENILINLYKDFKASRNKENNE